MFASRLYIYDGLAAIICSVVQSYVDRDVTLVFVFKMVPRFVFWWQLVVVVWHLAGDGQAGLRIARAIPEKKEGLYSNQDDVIILNSRNLRDRIYGKSMVWVVEFYNSWCGHCVKFAPTYKEFASDLKGS